YNHNVGKVKPVGSYPAGVSPYGVHDMAGNVWELCKDWYDANYYSYSPSDNPQEPSSGSSRIKRGGSFTSIGYHIRSAKKESIYC
ncbi:MAG: formylglycine-generating enzyme family protein, partial [Candidatus Aminicenantaceae bacterium]